MNASKSSNFNGKMSWPEASSIKQYFSLPSSIIYYIAKNPSTRRCYLKMMKSCKYFFEKNPIILFSHIHDNGKKICSNWYTMCCVRNHKCCMNIDITKMKSKIWFVNLLKFSNELPVIAFKILSKIFRCHGAKLVLTSITITWQEFKQLVGVFQKFDFDNVKITYDDGRTAMLDKIIEAIPELQTFKYKFDNNQIPAAATTSTMKKILQLENLDNLQTFALFNIPEIFTVDDLEEFITKYLKTKIRFEFRSNLSEDYKQHLDQLIYDILNCDARKRLIVFDGQNEEKHRAMIYNCFGY